MSERGKPVDWQLERLAQGELDPAQARALEERLGPEQTRERLAALEASNQEILAKLPPEVVAASIRRRQAEGARSRRAPLLLMAFVPLAALGVWAAVPRQASLMGEATEETRVKGAARLLVYRASGNGQQLTRLAESARVRPHDMIQLAYTAGEAKYGAVLSVDGRGVVTVHLPLAGDAPVALAATGEVRLPRSYELDDAPGFERFFLVSAPKPFSLSEVVDAARALARTPAEARSKRLGVNTGLSQESLLLEKARP